MIPPTACGQRNGHDSLDNSIGRTFTRPSKLLFYNDRQRYRNIGCRHVHIRFLPPVLLIKKDGRHRPGASLVHGSASDVDKHEWRLGRESVFYASRRTTRWRFNS